MKEEYLKYFGINPEELSLLPSKKNSVYLIKRGKDSYILKIYKLFGKKGFYREKWVISKNRPPLVPKIIDSYKKEVLLLEYIKGERIYDLPNSKFTPDLMENITEWFYKFHKENPGYIRGDAIPQNLILTKKGDIVGIDFEEARKGDINIDIAEFTAFILAWKRFEKKEAKKIAKESLSLWRKKTGYNIQPLIKDYLIKFFRKFYYFRKDKSLLDYIKNIDPLTTYLFS